jgi:hypothetical protein
LQTIWSRTEGLWAKAEVANSQVEQDKQSGRDAR